MSSSVDTQADLHLSRTLALAQTPQELLQDLLTGVDTFNNAYLWLYFFDTDADNLFDPPYFTASTFPPGSEHRNALQNSDIGKAWFGNEPAIHFSASIQDDQRFSTSGKALYERMRLQSLLVMPLKHGERWVGLLMAGWHESQLLGGSVMSQLEDVRLMVTPIVDNLRLRQRLEIAQEELAQAIELAQENMRMKSEFLAVISHELRTPLNGIQGYAGLLMMGLGAGPVEGKTRDYLERIQASSARLLKHLDNCLDMSRLSAGGIELTYKLLSPQALAQQWRDVYTPLAQAQGLTFEVVVDDLLPEPIYSDADKVTQIVHHLVDNALKFTATGSIRVLVVQQDRYWQVIVADTGIGIPPHAHALIFQEFRQVDSSSTRAYGGLGLGLSLAFRLARALHGTIELTSEPGHGSVFTVTLPLMVGRRG
ncbi:MAG: HAMP domain-containing sensor histidine kinase [Chloroflexota bacterium]|nr:HAMP domain-containing sensor histidine kinase [Chloroflexota bacterium]